MHFWLVWTVCNYTTICNFLSIHKLWNFCELCIFSVLTENNLFFCLTIWLLYKSVILAYRNTYSSICTIRLHVICLNCTICKLCIKSAQFKPDWQVEYLPGCGAAPCFSICFYPARFVRLYPSIIAIFRLYGLFMHQWHIPTDGRIKIVIEHFRAFYDVFQVVGISELIIRGNRLYNGVLTSVRVSCRSDRNIWLNPQNALQGIVWRYRTISGRQAAQSLTDSSVILSLCSLLLSHWYKISGLCIKHDIRDSMKLYRQILQTFARKTGHKKKSGFCSALYMSISFFIISVSNAFTEMFFSVAAAFIFSLLPFGSIKPILSYFTAL